VFGNEARLGAFSSELQNLHVGDEIQISTPEGIFRYFVTTIEIADPSGSRVRKSPGHPELTIMTTPRFPNVGAVPQQFIVHARPENELEN
jgi:sortase (surface protein transpeptidase)